MTPRQKKQIDSFEQAIEASLVPGNLISYAAASPFVDDVQAVANDIEKIITTKKAILMRPSIRLKAIHESGLTFQTKATNVCHQPASAATTGAAAHPSAMNIRFVSTSGSPSGMIRR